VINIDYGYRTIKGLKHNENEDTLLVCDNINLNRQALFVVCDGVGGYAGGKIASSTIANSLSSIFEKKVLITNPEEWIDKEIRIINRKLWGFSSTNPNYSRSSSTIAGVFINKDELFAFNVGDSRVYCRDRNGFRQISEDHSPVWLRYQNREITKNQMLEQPDKNKVSRALGFKDDVSVFQCFFKLDKYFQLLICSDGVTDFMIDSEIEKILSSTESTDSRLKLIEQKSLENGSEDDISIILIEGTSL